MKSMTGFGRANAHLAAEPSASLGVRGPGADGQSYVIEMRSVNHRGADVKIRLPWSEPVLEGLLLELVRSRISRGSVTVCLRAVGAESAQGDDARNPAARALRHREALSRLAKQLGFADSSVTLAMVLDSMRAEDRMRSDDGGLPPGEAEAFFQALRPAVEEALAALDAMRIREGRALAEELRAGADILSSITERLTAMVADAPSRHQAQLAERIGALLGGAQLDPLRLSQEVALLADRSDVREELVRLRAHIAHLRETLVEQQPVGRKLDFLLQEMMREINTLGSKSGQIAVAHLVVEAKGQLEKLRQQVQNVE